MTRGIEEALQQYLRAMGRLEPVPLGDAPDAASIDQEAASDLSPDDPVLREEGASLAAALAVAQRDRGRLTMVLIALLVVVFAVALYLAMRSGGSTGIALTAGSGAVATLLAVVAALQKLWRQKAMFDLLTAILQQSSPERAVDLVEAVFWSSFGGKKSGPN